MSQQETVALRRYDRQDWVSVKDYEKLLSWNMKLKNKILEIVAITSNGNDSTPKNDCSECKAIRDSLNIESADP